IAAESSDSDDRDSQWTGSSHLLDGSFHRFAAARVQIQQLCHLILGLGRWGCRETGGSAGFPGEIRMRGDKLQQVQGDVFGAARGV
ncbi:MAG TPA: hypothetical protein VHA37_07210, partial [Candidatus Saccharimonadales bacterium]|nr:hypothetical protein [Candidatus Saccharimonadales bacterium]